MSRPRATYRLQFRRGIGFREATAAVPYLHHLGISHLYASPLLAARAGSTHGYDVVDPTRLDPVLGSEADLDELCAELARHQMGLVLDIVPNHMAASLESPWWRDVLTHGRESEYAVVFDIDWDAPGLGGRLMMPVLDAPLEHAIAAGDVVVEPPLIRLANGLEIPMRPGSQRLDEQHYVLAHWRDANARVGYRRFFDIPDLVGIRVDDPIVFDLTHALILKLVREQKVVGLRVDHIDGLREPQGYLRRLRQAVGPDISIWVEKILSQNELLPTTWPISGTTGYEVSAAAVDALIDVEGARRLEEAYVAATGCESFAQVAAAGKREALVRLLAPDVLRVARALSKSLDREPESLAPELVEAAIALPVYRTYVRPGQVSDTDRKLLTDAVADDRLRAALLLDTPGTIDGALRFQQLTGPAMAKGVEDTALYRHHALAARNEVGAHPGEPPRGASALHEMLRARAQTWPDALAGLATHDSKRGPDARARLLALAEIAEQWIDAAQGLDALEEMGRPAGSPEIDANARWLLWQTIVGAWPLEESEHASFEERIRDYIIKAAREAKDHTSWTEPNEAYEAALLDLVGRALAAGGGLRSQLEALVEKVAWAGAVNGLALALLTIAAPGVPDIYQGTERWGFALVDPDNRRPVDFGPLAHDLTEMQAADPVALLGSWRDGRIKQLVIHRALSARRADPDLFGRGAYHEIDAGPHAIAFARALEGRWAICAVPRLPLRHPPEPLTLAPPPGAPDRWTDVLLRSDSEALSVFGRMPVALLTASS